MDRSLPCPSVRHIRDDRQEQLDLDVNSPAECVVALRFGDYMGCTVYRRVFVRS